MKHLGDITKINSADVPPVNVVIGGSPCQDLSVAGKRAGLAGERSGLFMEQIRIIKEMRKADEQRGRKAADVRPRYMVWENVPGAFSSNKGEDFRAVLEETIKIAEPQIPNIPIPQKGWPTAGCFMGEQWSVAWRVFDAQFWGVPQRRCRIALVADFRGQSAPEILFEREGVSRYTPPGRTSREDFAAAVAERFGRTNQARENGILDDYDRRHSSCTSVEVAPTVCAKYGTGGGNTPLVKGGCAAVDCRSVSEDTEINGTLQSRMSNNLNSNNVVRTSNTVRRLTPLECERLQDFPDGWTDIGEYIDTNGKKRKTSDMARYKALGNSIALPSWVWVLERLSYCCGADRTMASLFDGIGGFPLIWETLNGQGTCLWASEIEEFPIAVTKFHFA